MITAVCLNPSFDKTVELDALALGEVNRIRTIRQDVGGKGINVAVVARRLGLKARCVGLAGSVGVETIRNAMDKEGIEHDFLTIDGVVRTNTKIISGDVKGVTELNEPGTQVSDKELGEFFDLVRRRAQDSDYLVLTGSLPPGCPPETYRDLMLAVGDVPCVLDVGGEVLKLGAEAKPFLIKPNLQELQDTVGMELRTMRAIRDAATWFLQKGVQHVVVSMGSMGAMYVDKDTSVFAPALRVKVGSTVGAGDAMIGGLLKGLECKRTLPAAFRYGVAAGAASVMTEGTQLIVPEDFQTLLEQVRVQEV